eukprot:m.11815 g.11815  ORF g.11815 m.11815 type:complete len:332 (+) comp23629_c0_seq2:131-1126(+)
MASVSALAEQVLAALFYAVSSVSVVFIMKSVLTSNDFPSFQFAAIGQMMAAIVILRVAKALGWIDFPGFDLTIVRRMWPLPVLYIGNLVFGLGSTKRLSLPMFTALRRFSILMTLIGEKIILKYRSPVTVWLCVLLMIGGALVAAAADLSYDSLGYAYILLNDFFTAANGVCIKQKLDAKDLGKYGLLYYNCLFMIVPAILLAFYTGDMDKVVGFAKWADYGFVVQFCLSCLMGFVLMYSTVLCTAVNSALTTTIVGCLKNIVVTYFGVVFGGDYIFSHMNFVGLNISVFGSLLYSYVKYREQKKSQSVSKPPVVTNKFIYYFQKKKSRID